MLSRTQTENVTPKMILSIDEAQDQLSEACQGGYAERVSQLFTGQTLSADDATNALRDAYMDDFMLIHVLLQNGADVTVVEHATSRGVQEQAIFCGSSLNTNTTFVQKATSYFSQSPSWCHERAD
jgi:hypothetical protein